MHAWASGWATSARGPGASEDAEDEAAAMGGTAASTTAVRSVASRLARCRLF